MGKKSAPKGPSAKDTAAAAAQTAASNAQAQATADWANRPDQVDMYGNRTSWQANAVRDPVTGQMVNKWTQQTTLSPQQQQALNSQMNLQQGMMGQAESMLGRAKNAYSQPFDTSGMAAWAQGPQGGNYQTGGAGEGMMTGLNMSSLGAMPQADAQERQRIENMMFQRMAPQHQQAQSGLEAKLSNMGLTRGSAAWNKEMQRLGDQQSRERFNAMEVGGNEMQRLFGMGMQGRQQGFNELLQGGQFQNQAQQQGFNQRMGANAQNFGMMQSAADFQNQVRGQQMQEAQNLRNMPLNELNAFMSGQQVQGPQFQQFGQSRSSGGTDFSGAQNQAYNNQLDAYNAKQQQSQGLMSGIGGIASTALMVF